jgi:phage terminase large subunit
MGDDYETSKWNATDHIYNFGAAQMEFFSADDDKKLRGGRRDVLFINEANNISKRAFDELQVRTRRFTFLDHNPVSEYWAHEMKSRSDVEWIHSTYQDAKNVLPAEIITNIESRKGKDPNWWNVYGLGLLGNIEGLVHPSFDQVDILPDGGIDFYGLDFGFSNDPTVLIHCKTIKDHLYSDELIYEKGLNNEQICHRLEQSGVRKGYDEIFADSAEPKSISEIALHGYNIQPAPKGKDSVVAGIQRVNQYHQHWTKRSVSSIKEQRNYRYIQTMDSKITNKPIDDWNHAMDARRYALMGKIILGGNQLFTFGADIEEKQNV